MAARSAEAHADRALADDGGGTTAPVGVRVTDFAGFCNSDPVQSYGVLLDHSDSLMSEAILRLPSVRVVSVVYSVGNVSMDGADIMM